MLIFYFREEEDVVSKFCCMEAVRVVGTGMNVAIDCLFVFAFDWGMFGAAFATALCSGIGCGLNIVFAYTKNMHIRFQRSAVKFGDILHTMRNGTE